MDSCPDKRRPFQCSTISIRLRGNTSLSAIIDVNVGEYDATDPLLSMHMRLECGMQNCNTIFNLNWFGPVCKLKRRTGIRNAYIMFEWL